MLSRVGQDTLRSIFPENALCSPSLGSASHQAKGSRGSAENPKGLGEAREMFMVLGGATSHSDLRETGEHQALSGHILPGVTAAHLSALSREGR